jgi:hypothetical protein
VSPSLWLCPLVHESRSQVEHIVAIDNKAQHERRWDDGREELTTNSQKSCRSCLMTFPHASQAGTSPDLSPDSDPSFDDLQWSSRLLPNGWQKGWLRYIVSIHLHDMRWKRIVGIRFSNEAFMQYKRVLWLSSEWWEEWYSPHQLDKARIIQKVDKRVHQPDELDNRFSSLSYLAKRLKGLVSCRLPEMRGWILKIVHAQIRHWPARRLVRGQRVQLASYGHQSFSATCVSCMI